MNKQDTINLLKLDIAAEETLLKLKDDIVAVVKKFDNKVPTKRITTALKKVDDNLRFTAQYNSMVIEMYTTNRSVQSTTGTSWVYISNSCKTILHSCLRSSSNNGCLNDDGTINASQIIKDINIYAEYKQKSITDLKKQIKNIDKITAKFEGIKEQQSQFLKDTNINIMSYLNLKF